MLDAEQDFWLTTSSLAQYTAAPPPLLMEVHQTPTSRRADIAAFVGAETTAS